MISSVSFSSAAPTDFKTLVQQGQKYTKPTETPSAAAPLNNKKPKKGSLAKKLLAVAAVAAGVMTLLGVGSSKGWFAVKEGGNKVLNTIKPYLETAGNFIKDKASAVYTKVSDLFKSKNVEEVVEAAEDVISDGAQQI